MCKASLVETCCVVWQSQRIARLHSVPGQWLEPVSKKKANGYGAQMQPVHTNLGEEELSVSFKLNKRKLN